MIDEDTMTEYFEFHYRYYDGEDTTDASVCKTYQGGTSLYVEDGVVEAFLTFLRGAGYNPEKLQEALEEL